MNNTEPFLIMPKFIEPYNPNWITEFENIKQVIESELTDLIPQIDIQHIGSTSIPGLISKPILDIDIILHNKALIELITLRLEKIGYINKGEQGIPGRFVFRQTSEFMPLATVKRRWQSHHLYVCYADSLALKNHLLFRDTLLNDNALVEQYAELKLSLTENLIITRQEYTTKKTAFIIAILARAGLDETELQAIAKANT